MDSSLKACLEENHRQDGRGSRSAANLIPADMDAVLTLCGFTNDNDRRKFWLAEGWTETVDFGMFSYKEIEAMASRAE